MFKQRIVISIGSSAQLQAATGLPSYATDSGWLITTSLSQNCGTGSSSGGGC